MFVELFNNWFKFELVLLGAFLASKFWKKLFKFVLSGVAALPFVGVLCVGAFGVVGVFACISSFFFK